MGYQTYEDESANISILKHTMVLPLYASELPNISVDLYNNTGSIELTLKKNSERPP